MTMGFISVTNTQVWIFNLDPNGQSVGEQDARWVLEIPSRPGFRLAVVPESSMRSLPQRMKRQDYALPPSTAVPPRALRLPETNSSK
jgi:hypothetical protein